MNEPLASAAGNAVEVENAVDFLTGRRRDRRLEEVTLALAAEMLVVGRHRHRPTAKGWRWPAKRCRAAGRPSASRAWSSISAVRPISSRNARQPSAPRARSSSPRRRRARASSPASPRATSALPSSASAAAGRGRTTAIDHAVGFTRLLPVGSEVRQGEALALVHARRRCRCRARGGVRSSPPIRSATQGPRPASRSSAVIGADAAEAAYWSAPSRCRPPGICSAG